MKYNVFIGDCLDGMASLPENHVDTIISDPPYGISFMGKNWDYGVPGVEFWKQALRVAKPGAMLLAFGGTRMYHRLSCAIEDAGWEIRDCMSWLYGSGFPKSHSFSSQMNGESSRWDGWGTALKPAWEPIILAMKPTEGTFAENALKHEVAGLNVDGSHVSFGADQPTQEEWNRKGSTGHCGGDGRLGQVGLGQKAAYAMGRIKVPTGRFPANVLLDEEAARQLDVQTGNLKAGGSLNGSEPSDAVEDGGVYAPRDRVAWQSHGDSGGASRFFYCAKAAKSEKTAGGTIENKHPTVKPIPLMRYLCRLTKTPTGGVVLDPFMGSGSTGVAALLEGRTFLGMDLDRSYVETAVRRMEHALAQPDFYE